MEANVLDQELASLVKPRLARVASHLGRTLEAGRIHVEESRTEEFPWSTSLTVRGVGDDDDLIIEVALHTGDRGIVVTAELLTESGELLSPALVRKLPSSPRASELLMPFVDLLDSFLRVGERTLLRLAGTGLTRVPVPMDDVGTDNAGDPWLSRDAFDRLARSVLSQRFHESFQSRPVLLLGGQSVDFDFVSPHGRIVGQAKWTTSPRAHTASVTELIWQLQHVAEADARFLVVGPESTVVHRWLAKYGMDAADPVQLWALEETAATRVA